MSMQITPVFRSNFCRLNVLKNSKRIMSTLIIEQTNTNNENVKDAQYKTEINNETFVDFILSYPSGAYTSMRTVRRNSIVEFQTHMDRITNALDQLKFGSTSQDIETANRALCSFRKPDEFKQRILPLLKTGLEAFYEKADTNDTSETKISIMVTYSFETNSPVFAAHFAKLPALPATQRVKVKVERKTRKAPEIKDSQWVRDRSELEKAKEKDINEVILMDEHTDDLYEGAGSNFLVVKNLNGSPTVMCAPLNHILMGTILKIVLQICEDNRINFEWTFPKLKDAKEKKWIGCFITSTSRLLLPIEAMHVGDERIEFKEKSKEIEFLKEQVAKEIYNRAYKIL